MPREFQHISVLLTEAVGGLNVREDGIYIDCTAGGGGHSREILRRGGRLIAFDRDADAICAIRERLSGYEDRYTLVHSNYADFEDALDDLKIGKIDGALMDLGTSSFQLDCAERGFSYQQNARLDMRMDQSSPLSAYEIVNAYEERELSRVIYEYGEERFARRIAARIAAEREKKPIETTFELADLIKDAIPAQSPADIQHCLRRTFQGLRIETNSEISVIPTTLRAITERLNAGGRIAVITFHSLEDRAVKTTFADLASGCTCPKDFPVCVCGKKPKLKLVNKKPILPSDAEQKENPRSHSAKLRVAERVNCENDG